MRTYLLCCLSFLFSVHLNAQQQMATSADLSTDLLQKEMLSSVVERYFDASKDYAVIYNYKVHEGYPNQFIGNPYFRGPEYSKSAVVCFDGIEYPDVSLRLDSYRDELTILSPNQLYNIVLQNDKVEYAYLHGYYVFYLYPDGRKGCPNPGYYIRLYDGNCKVLEKESYLLLKRTEGYKVQTFFSKTTNFYILKDDVYHIVSNKKSILSVFGLHKKELNQYINQQKLDFKNNPEDAIVSIVKYYDTLTE